MPRRLNCLVLFAFISVLLGGSLFFSAPIRKKYHTTYGNAIKPAPGSLEQPPSLSNGVDETSNDEIQSPPSQTLHVSITETGGSHDEVVAALVHAFGSQPRVEIALYQLLSRYGIADVMQAFELSHKLPTSRGPREFPKAQVHPDIFVSSTCELDVIDKYLKTFVTTLLEGGKTYLFCVVHHADRWGAGTKLEEAISPWIEKGRVEFLTLSSHTAKFFAVNGVTKWKVVTEGKHEPIIRYLVPVFPVDIPDHHAPAEGEFPVADDENELGFALQGDYDSGRRDYKHLFERLSEFLNSDGDGVERNLTMHLLGHGNRPAVPENIKSNVEFNERLPYMEFYTILSRAFALLPAFASDDYLDRKASSSVPAALIAGVPLVATDEMIQAYEYLNHDIVWPQKKSQSDIDVVAEILKMTPEERRKKKQAVRDKRNDIIKGNVKRVHDWIEEALESMGRPS